MSTILMAMAILLQVPDTLTVRVPLPVLERTEPVPVRVDVQVHTDSLAAAYERAAAAAERAGASAVAVEPCGCGGVPSWFWGGVLVVGGAAAGALWYHVVHTHRAPEDADPYGDDDIDNPPARSDPHPHGHKPGRKHGH